MTIEKKNWFKQHVDSVITVSTLIGGFFILMTWLDGKFDRINERFDKVNERFTQVDNRINQVEKDIAFLRTDIAIIKTVLQMKNIMPQEVAKCEKKGE